MTTNTEYNEDIKDVRTIMSKDGAQTTENWTRTSGVNTLENTALPSGERRVSRPMQKIIQPRSISYQRQIKQPSGISIAKR